MDWPEDCYVVGVAASPEAAVALVKSRYDDHYKIAWGEPNDEGIAAHFTGVVGYSTEHDAEWSFTPYEISEEVMTQTANEPST